MVVEIKDVFGVVIESFETSLSEEGIIKKFRAYRVDEDEYIVPYFNRLHINGQLKGAFFHETPERIVYGGL